jgi:hypothetical protein
MTDFCPTLFFLALVVLLEKWRCSKKEGNFVKCDKMKERIEI